MRSKYQIKSQQSVTSFDKKDDFLKNAQAQENAMLKYTNTHWKQIRRFPMSYR